MVCQKGTSRNFDGSWFSGTGITTAGINEWLVFAHEVLYEIIT
jgi:hypothetical protein